MFPKAIRNNFLMSTVKIRNRNVKKLQVMIKTWPKYIFSKKICLYFRDDQISTPMNTKFG